ncbi:MAG: FecR domain-containing protein [Sphingomonadales bacterium]|nr:FecR domain-containing protein [Sphingomonadales bacterium]MDE2169404.1 FecR domain-containing protein [Sphingomonadales bacterium]
MNEGTDTPPSGDQLRHEAAHWFSLMRGPDADERRDDFNRWLASSAAHRRAYNSISEKFNLGKGLKDRPAVETLRPQASLATNRPIPSVASAWGKRAVLAGSIATLCLVGGWYAIEPKVATLVPGPFQGRREDREARFATSIGEIRNFVLLDGSTLTLDTNSIVLASYTPGERGLRLIQGRARFTVAKDARPFIVRADTTVVTARGTTFDMQFEGNRQIAVHPVNGPVDVQTQSDRDTTGLGHSQALEPLLTRLATGQRLLVDDQQVSMAINSMQNDDQWPEGVEAFNDVALSDLVASLNRYAKKPVTITDARIGAMRISGTYRLLDTGAVIRKVADLLKLVVTEDTAHYRLHRP